MATRREHLNRMAKRFILEACARVVSQKGAAATIEDIAREADYSTGALYNYFKNKEEMLAELFTYVTEEFLDQVLKPLPPQYSFEQCMSIFNQEAMGFATARTPLLRTLVLDFPVVHARIIAEEASTPEVNAMLGRFQAYLSEILRRGVTEGVLRDDLDCDLGAWALLGVYHFLFHYFVISGEEPYSGFMAQVPELVLRGFRKG